MGRILGIDYGTKNIGLALTDEIPMFASPLETISNDPQCWEKLDIIIKKYNITTIVIGMPLHDQANSFEPQVLGFIRKLKKIYTIPLYIQDESLTSKDSRDFLIQTGKKGKKLKQNLDKFAAQAILSGFLQQHEKGKTTPFEE